MWLNILKTRSHWMLLDLIEQRFVSFCRRVGLLYELTFPYELGDNPNGYNRNYDKQYEFLYNLLEGVLNDMARNGNPVQEKEINQPTPLGAEDFRHHVRLAVEDASFYLFAQFFRTEPFELIFHTEMSFTVPKKFWGRDTKTTEIEKEISDFVGEIFVISYNNFANMVIDNLDIKEFNINEDLLDRVSPKAPVKEGTERERWWE